MQASTGSRIAANALELIGNTPLVRLEKVTPAGNKSSTCTPVAMEGPVFLTLIV